MKVRVDVPWSPWHSEATTRAVEVAESLYKRHGALALRSRFESPVTLARDESIVAPVVPTRVRASAST